MEHITALVTFVIRQVLIETPYIIIKYDENIVAYRTNSLHHITEDPPLDTESFPPTLDFRVLVLNLIILGRFFTYF